MSMLLGAARRISSMPYFRGRERLTNGVLRLGGTVRIQLDGFDFALDPADGVARHIALRRELPSDIPHTLSELAQPGMTAVDVGASIGYTTLKLARAVGMEGQVYAFEPSARAFASLTRNLALNGCSWVHAERVACGERAGEVELHVANVSTEYSSLRPSSLRGQSESVPAIRLDDRIFSADLLKIDTEGAEWQVLQGAESLLRSRPIIVVETLARNTERFGYHPEEMLNWLSGFGYEIERRGSDAICR
jgi:FkbM family methyltransferase